jgi:hypothetical protein
MRLSNLFLNAAKRVFANDDIGCCDAIYAAYFHAGGDDNFHVFLRALDDLTNYFEPANVTIADFWWRDPPADREARILALLLMHEIAKDDE